MTDRPTRDDRRANPLSTQESRIEYSIDAGEAPSASVVRAVASLTNVPVLDLDPLYDVVDPAHLDGLFGGRGDGAMAERSITFVFDGCRVTVTQDVIRVRECGDAAG